MDLFSRFWEVRIMIFGYFGDPGAHFWGPGAHSGGPGANLKISEIIVILGVATPRKWRPILRHISTFFNFLQCYFFMFFRVLAFSIFCDFRCPEAPFLYQVWRYFESPGALKKPLKLCNCHQFQRFGPFQIQSFCKSWLWVRFDSEFFRILWFLAVLRVPFWDLLVLIVVKKEVWKKDVKNDEKGVCK